MKDLNAVLLRLDEKLDSLQEKQGEMNTTLTAQHEQLAYHIKRTDLLELELKPIKNHVQFVNHLAKALAAAGSIALFAKELGLF